MCVYRRVLDSRTDSLTTYTQDSELEAITSSTLNVHNSQITTAPAKPFSSLLCFHQPFPGNGFWQWRFFSSRDQVLSSQTPVQNYQLTLSLACNISRHGPHRKHSSSIVAMNCSIIKNLMPSNGNVFTEPLLRNGRCLQSHLLATGLYATFYIYKTFCRS
jgi:hypothetical protein